MVMETEELEEYAEDIKIKKKKLKKKWNLITRNTRNNRGKEICSKRRKVQQYQGEFTNM
jgi:hypothetical protein